MAEPHQTRIARVLLAATRVWLPVGIAVAGVAMIFIGGGRVGNSQGLLGNSTVAAAGVALIIAAAIVWMINWMYRMSIESNREREREDAARDYFEQHGRWPDE